MGRIGPNYAASDGAGVGVISIILIIVGIAALHVAVKNTALDTQIPHMPWVLLQG